MTPRRRREPLPFPVRTEEDYARAIALLDDLVPLDRPSAAERDFIDIMLPVVEAYESRHHRFEAAPLAPLDLLRSLMEDQGMNASDLGRLLGARSLGGAILRGERELSKTHIRILAERFKMNPAVFLAPGKGERE